MKWTDQQESAITTEGSDILVSAAAGSGKTAVLTERIKRLILEKGMSIENMLIVTFSNAAAAEMKEKIIKALKAAAAEPGPDQARLNAQIRKARTADISTFHKFAIIVIRRYFYTTDIDQNFGICDESRRLILIGETLDELIEDRFEGGVQMSMSTEGSGQAGEPASPEEVDPGDSGRHQMAFTEFLRSYSSVRNENNVRDMILNVYRFIMSMPDPFEWLQESADAASVDIDAFRASAIYQALRRENLAKVMRIEKIFLSVCEDTEGIESIYKKALADYEKVRALVNAAETGTDQEMSSALDFKMETFRAGKADKDEFDLIKNMISARRKRAKGLLDELKEDLSRISMEDSLARINKTWPSALYLADLVKEFHSRFTAKKREKNLLDFNDLEHAALAILKNEEIAASYREHFKVIFIDEYQDSSILQETLIQRISRGDNVYMVGDVKQSIYKFRLAEPEIFIGKYNGFRDGSLQGTRIDLNRNFRSKGNIIRAVNAVFRNIMNRETCGIDYDEDAELKKGGSYEGELDRQCVLHIIDSGNDENNPDIDSEIADLQASELEAKYVARLAADRLGMEIYDQKKDEVRKIGYNDIVVLMRGVRSSADIYAEALKEVGIPAYVEAGEGFFETTEIEVFMNLLRIIDNRRSDLPLISVLYSPVFGFTSDELVHIRLFDNERKRSYNEAFASLAAAGGYVSEEAETQQDGQDFGPELSDDMKALADKCCRVWEKLDVWRRKSRFMPLEEFLWHLMKETSYLDYVRALPAGERRAANLRMLVDKAVSFTEAGSGGLFSFLRYVDAMNEGQVAVGQSLQQTGGDEMVRIMTIHKSKGLEFPVVILAGLGKSFGGDKDSGNVIMHRELGMALKYNDPEGKFSSRTLSQKVIAAQRKREQMAEEMRILYVAMTRPMDELIMTACVKKSEELMESYRQGTKGGVQDAGCFLDWIVPYCEQGEIAVEMLGRQDISAEKKAETENAENLAEEMKKGFPSFRDEKGMASMLAERFAFEYPHKSDVDSKSKYAVSELNKVLKGARPPKRAAADISEDPAGLSQVRDHYADLVLADEVTQDTAGGDEESQGQTMPEGYKVPLFMREEEEFSPAMRGTLTHLVMELIPFSEDNDEAFVKEFVDSLPQAGHMTRAEADQIDCAKVARFFGSEIGKRACRAKWIRKEWHFTLKKKKSEIAAMAADSKIAGSLTEMLSDEVMIQGIIDCCFCDEKGIVILDYKTDRVDQRNREATIERLKKEYKRQLELYAEVVEKALGERVTGKVLFLLDSGDTAEL